MIILTPTTARHWERSSPSQVKTFDDCTLKWWRNKICPAEERPDTAAQARGKRVHKLLEHWLEFCKQRGEWIYEFPEIPAAWGLTKFEVDMAANARGWVAQTVDLATAHAEGEVRLKTLYGTPILMIRDIVCDRGVTDYKTTKDYKWVPSEEELRKDPQCVSYMRAWFEDTLCSQGRYQHIYMNTTSGACMSPLKFTATKTENDDRWGILSDKVLAQKHYSQYLREDEVPHAKGAACNKFGGCEFRDTCHVHQGQGSIFMGLFDKIKNKDDNGNKYTAEDDKDSVTDKINGALQEAGYTLAQIKGMSPAERARLAAKWREGQLSPEEVAASRVNPPDGTPDEEETELPAAAYMGAVFPGSEVKVKGCGATPLIEWFSEEFDLDEKEAKTRLKELRAANDWTAAELREEVCKYISGIPNKLIPEEPKKEVKVKITSMKKVKEEPKEEIATERDALTAKRAAERIKQAKKEAAAQTLGVPRMLFMECVPVGVDFTPFHEWARPGIKAIEEKTGHMYLLLDFRKGEVLLAAMVKEHAEGKSEIDFGEWPENMVVMFDTHQAIIEVLSEVYPATVHRIQ